MDSDHGVDSDLAHGLVSQYGGMVFGLLLCWWKATVMLDPGQILESIPGLTDKSFHRTIGQKDFKMLTSALLWLATGFLGYALTAWYIHIMPGPDVSLWDLLKNSYLILLGPAIMALTLTVIFLEVVWPRLKR